jgi:hypothetical protein
MQFFTSYPLQSKEVSFLERFHLMYKFFYIYFYNNPDYGTITIAYSEAAVRIL